MHRTIACLTAAALLGCSAQLAPPESNAGGRAAPGFAGTGAGVGEVWVTAQDAGELKILTAAGDIETIALGPDSGPHEITFSPNGRYAYVANMGDGRLVVIRAADRGIAAAVALGPAHTHQAVPSPDGSVVLATQMHHRTLVKLAADENAEEWRVTGHLVLDRPPVCAVFRTDGQRAYVSLAPDGLAIVDVPAMTLLGTLPTAGGVQCGLVSSRDGRTIYVDSNGEDMETGHFYLLDTVTDRLELHVAFPASDLHGFDVDASERWAYVAERGADRLRRIDLRSPGANPAIISLDHTPGTLDRPDKVAIRGDEVFVTLRSTGALARVARATGAVHYVQLAPPSNYALHGIAVRP